MSKQDITKTDPALFMRPEYDLRVRYPRDGEHLVLCWHSHDEGQHIILAKNERAIETCLDRAVQKHIDLQIRWYMRATLVAPTEQMRQVHAQNVFYDDVRWFWEYISRMCPKPQKLPAGIERCKKRSKNGTFHEYDCKGDCIQAVRPVDGDFVTPYLQRRALLESFPKSRKPYRMVGVLPSALRPGDPSLPYYEMKTDFGHHQTGLKRQGVNELISDYWDGSRSLFYFQSPEDLDLTKFNKRVEDVRLKWKKKDADRWEIHKQKRAREEQLEREQFESLFKG